MFYLDCTNIPLEHLELIIREVYLPLLCTNQQNLTTTGGDKVMDVLHRLMSVVEVSQGHAEVSRNNLSLNSEPLFFWHISKMDCHMIKKKAPPLQIL